MIEEAALLALPGLNGEGSCGSGLLLRYSFPGLTRSFPLEIVDDGRAFIRGKGTGLGETIAFREEAGRTILEWSGMRFEKR